MGLNRVLMNHAMHTALTIAVLVVCSASSSAFAQTVQPLWPGEPPGVKGTAEADIPTLTRYPVSGDANSGAAVVVCPGGGYGGLSKEMEGTEVAAWLNGIGVNAFVLHYRLSPYRHPIPLQDAQRAIRTVRSRADEWGVDPKRIGILGFSAGGHLASTAGTHFDDGDKNAKDSIERVSCRPDFMVLVYPVITMTDPYTHRGSRKNLLGDDASPELIALLSNEKQVTAETPPAFLFHTHDDKAVPAENSLMFYQALRNHGVPGELHVYEPGAHGAGLGKRMPALNDWPERCVNWFRTRGIIE